MLWLLYPLVVLPTSRYEVTSCIDTTAFFNASITESHMVLVVLVVGQHMLVLYHLIEHVVEPMGRFRVYVALDDDTEYQ